MQILRSAFKLALGLLALSFLTINVASAEEGVVKEKKPSKAALVK
jgi:hypothetical protein